LNLETGVSICGHRIALNEREVEAGSLPVGVSFSFETYVAGDQADAYDAIFYIVFIRFLLSGA
jgi:hypothetical protein